MTRIRNRRKAVEIIEEQLDTIQRTSKQPRISNPNQLYQSVYTWLYNYFGKDDEPTYSPFSMVRDAWLRTVWPKENHLAGVINSVVDVDKNRGWELVGGRNQVNRFTEVLRNYENGTGWRYGIGQAATAYYTADIGSLVETEREGEGGPLLNLYNVDPARCLLTGNPVYPLQYHPSIGLPQNWQPFDYFRAASMISTDETYNGLGFCALSRCIELTKLMLAVYQHDAEELGARMPRGLLLLQGISQTQWEEALASRDVKKDQLGHDYFGGVMILAQSGMEQIGANLVALSNLPKGFDLRVFTDLLMYSYALVFGYDPREFWPVAGGQLGTATESEVQSRKATRKGGLDFALAYQDQLQRQLPESLHFEFEQSDPAGEIVEAGVQQAQVNIVKSMYESGLMQGSPVITREEARQLLANFGVIPEDWTLAEEAAKSTDTQDANKDQQQAPNEQLERYLEFDKVQRAISLYPNEPIVRYCWPLDKTTVLWRSGREAIRRLYPITREVLYKSDDGKVVITEDDVQSAIDKGRERVGEEFAELLEGKPYHG